MCESLSSCRWSQMLHSLVLFQQKLPSQSVNLANEFTSSQEYIAWTDNTLHIGWKERTSNKVEMLAANFQLLHSLAHQNFGLCQEELSWILKIQQDTTDNTSHSIPSWWRSRSCCGELMQLTSEDCIVSVRLLAFVAEGWICSVLIFYTRMLWLLILGLWKPFLVQSSIFLVAQNRIEGYSSGHHE